MGSELRAHSRNTVNYLTVDRTKMTTTKPLLPPRFQKVADCIILGLGEKEIPEKVGLTFATVRSYVRTMYKRLGVHNRAQLVAKLMTSTAPVSG